MEACQALWSSFPLAMPALTEHRRVSCADDVRHPASSPPLFTPLIQFHIRQPNQYIAERCTPRTFPLGARAVVVQPVHNTEDRRMTPWMFGAQWTAYASTVVRQTICNASACTDASCCGAFPATRRHLDLANSLGTLKFTWLSSACHCLSCSSRAHRHQIDLHHRPSDIRAHNRQVPTRKTNYSDLPGRGRWQSMR